MLQAASSISLWAHWAGEVVCARDLNFAQPMVPSTYASKLGTEGGAATG